MLIPDKDPDLSSSVSSPCSLCLASYMNMKKDGSPDFPGSCVGS